MADPQTAPTGVRRPNAVLGGSPWREHILTRAAELQALVDALEPVLEPSPPETDTAAMLRAMRGQLPSLVTTAHAHLPSDDQRRRKIEDIASSNTATRDGLNAHQRDAIVAAARGAYAVGRREVMRLRSFRNVLVVSAAVLGLLLMRSEFIPGLSALDSPAQIIAWAVLLGYGQQLLTRFVDQRAQAILDASGGQTKPADD